MWTTIPSPLPNQKQKKESTRSITNVKDKVHFETNHKTIINFGL